MGELTQGTLKIEMFKDMRTRYNNWIKDPVNKGQLPSKIYTVKNGQYYVILTVFDDMVERVDKFILANRRDPETVDIVKSTPTSPWKMVRSYKYDHQDTGYTCGPTSMSMGLTELFPGSGSREAELAKYAGTTTSGTPHSGLTKAFMKEMELKGLKGQYWEKGISEISLSELGDALIDPDVFVIAHGNTGGWPSYWLNSYGHYVYPIGVNPQTGQFKIADPTKGVLLYSKTEFENGLRRVVNQKSYLFFKVLR